MRIKLLWLIGAALIFSAANFGHYFEEVEINALHCEVDGQVGEGYMFLSGDKMRFQYEDGRSLEEFWDDFDFYKDPHDARVYVIPHNSAGEKAAYALINPDGSGHVNNFPAQDAKLKNCVVKYAQKEPERYPKPKLRFVKALSWKILKTYPARLEVTYEARCNERFYKALQENIKGEDNWGGYETVINIGLLVQETDVLCHGAERRTHSFHDLPDGQVSIASIQ